MRIKLPIIIMGSKASKTEKNDDGTPLIELKQSQGFTVIECSDIRFYMDASTKLDVVTVHMSGGGEQIIIPVHLSMLQFEDRLRLAFKNHRGLLSHVEKDLQYYLENNADDLPDYPKPKNSNDDLERDTDQDLEEPDGIY